MYKKKSPQSEALISGIQQNVLIDEREADCLASLSLPKGNQIGSSGGVFKFNEFTVLICLGINQPLGDESSA